MSEPAVEASLMDGTVKWFDPNKGWGFIKLPDGQRDVFLHVKELRKSGIVGLNDGDRVSFMRCKGDKGHFATDIKKLTG